MSDDDPIRFWRALVLALMASLILWPALIYAASLLRDFLP